MAGPYGRAPVGGGTGAVKKLLNTVYVTTEGAALRKDGENLVAEVEGEEKARVPLHMLASVVVFGPIFLSPALVAACAEAGICIALLGRNGRFQARIEGPVSGNVLLRRAQYRASDRPEDIVRSLVVGKVSNQRAVLMRALRDYGGEMEVAVRDAIAAVVERLAYIMRRVELAGEDVDRLRGSEGEAANLYFSVFDHLVRAPDAEMRWAGRSRRPPLDPLNALLSFLYTLLTHDCRSACESVGLDPAVGFLHRDRPGRPSLALDLMEELRPVLVDRLALSLVNRRQLRADDFDRSESGAVLLTDEARRTVLTAWQERKKDERQHAFLEEKAPLGLVPFLQAQMLARHLRGDLDAYPPWFWK
jgi:CRISPR-associated protein Cas1